MKRTASDNASGQVLAIIPARSGSKGIVHKNVKNLGGYPLLAWSIVAARHCKSIDRVVLSTDSAEYAAIGREYGAECPFLRPAELAGDTSADREFLCHAVQWLRLNDDYFPEFVCLLRPTTPFRKITTLEDAITAFAASTATSLCSGYEMAESPVKTFRLTDEGCFTGFMGDEWLCKPRQLCPKAYVWDGVIDIFRTDRLMSNDEIYGPGRMAWLTEPNIEIDTEAEWKFAEYLVSTGHADHLLKLLKEQKQWLKSN